MSWHRRNFVIFVIFAFSWSLVGADQTPVRVMTYKGLPLAGPALHYDNLNSDRPRMQVELVQHPFDKLYDEIMIGFVTGQLDMDVLLIPSAWLPDFAPYLSTVPDELLKNNIVKDIHPDFRDALMKWEQQWMALSIDADMRIGVYRRDLFSDPDNIKAFKRQFGRLLTAPQTWSEYSQIAEFFSTRAEQDKKPLAGTLESLSQGEQRLLNLFSRAAAYVNHPEFPGRMFFDPVTMKPSITNPAWQRALREYIEVGESISSDIRSQDNHQLRSRFMAGDAAMIIDWTEIGILATDSQKSLVSKDIGFFPLPRSMEAWNPKKRKWEQLNSAGKPPSLAIDALIGVVSKSALEPERAWAYLLKYASLEHNTKSPSSDQPGFNPYRLSHLERDTHWYAFMEQSLADQFLSMIHKNLTVKFSSFELRIPGYRAYIKALDEQIEQVLQNNISIYQALHIAAEKWERITDRLGRQSQRRHYRASVGLPEVTP